MLLCSLCDKIPVNKGAIIGGGFLIFSITCISRIKVGLHTKMAMLLIKTTLSKSILKIVDYTKSIMLVDL